MVFVIIYIIYNRFDEHAQIDLPTMLDYVMKTTGQDELFYGGHSQGTAMGFAGFTFNQSLAQHIKAFFALAPVSTVKYIKGLFAFIAEKLDVSLVLLWLSKPLIVLLGVVSCRAWEHLIMLLQLRAIWIQRR